MNTLGDIIKVIEKAESVALFMHVRPDGDTVGSAFGLKLALEQAGKRVEVFCEDVLPNYLGFMTETQSAKTELKGEFSLLIAIDCADIDRVGKFAYDFNKHKNTVNIDHHISNTRYAKINYVMDKASNSENIYDLIKEWGVEITETIANYLAMGILTDTGNFYHQNLTADTLRTAGELVDNGANINKTAFNVFHKQTKARAKLFGLVMSKIRYFLDDKFAVATVFKQDVKEAGALPENTEGFIDFVMDIDCVLVGASVMEVDNNKYKVSLRSKGPNVSEVAGVFGGGGHILASGCRIEGAYEEVIDRLVYAVKQHIPE